MEIGAIIAGLLTIAGAVLKWYLGRDRTYEALQVGRQDIANGDAAAISKRIDGLLADQARSPGDNPPGEPDDQDIARRLKNITGV